MRILHVLDHSIPLHSGYSFRTISILKEQRRRGWETFQITGPKQNSNGMLQEQADGWLFHRTPAGRSNPLPGLKEATLMRDLTRRLHDVAREIRPDILHAHSPVLNAIPALRVGRKLGIPVLYEVRAFWEDAAVDHGTATDWGLRYRLTRQLETYALRRVDAITAICAGIRNDLLQRDIPSERITIIPNAVDLADFPASVSDKDLLRDELGLGGCTVIGFIGSFYGYEGLELLIQALASFREVRKDVRLLLVGGGPQEKTLKTLTADLGLADRVIFTGRVSHNRVIDYYSAVDLFVYPRLPMRLTETVTPLKPLEAMALGKLVVASDVGGHRELVRHQDNGILFPAGSVDALSKTILDTLSRPDTWAGIGSRARTFVERERTWAESVSRYAPVYESLLTGKTTRAEHRAAQSVKYYDGSENGGTSRAGKLQLPEDGPTTTTGEPGSQSS